MVLAMAEAVVVGSSWPLGCVVQDMWMEALLFQHYLFVRRQVALRWGRPKLLVNRDPTLRVQVMRGTGAAFDW